MASRGAKKELKAWQWVWGVCVVAVVLNWCGQEWAELHGTRLRYLGSHFMKALGRTPNSRPGVV